LAVSDSLHAELALDALEHVEPSTGERADWWNRRRFHGAVDHLPARREGYVRRWAEQTEAQLA
jgi:hypothetical protein